MKRVFLIVLLASLAVYSCNSDNQKKNPPVADAKIKSVAAPQDAVTTKTEELKKSTPVGLDQLSSWLPGELNGIKRSNLTMSSDMGYAVAHADYEKNNKTDIRVTVYDCSGETGANLYKTTYASKLKESQETEDSYTKTIDFMGGKAVEHHEKKNKVTTLTYMASNQILLVVSARNLDPETVREAAQKLGNKG